MYQIIAGALRTHQLLPDRRHRINAFRLPGDMLGLENGATHRFTAETITETKVRLAWQRRLLDSTTQREVSAMNFMGLITRNLQRADSHMLLLGRRAALEGAATSLLEMDERLGHPDVTLLPMNRRDIADYQTLETVSRALSSLRNENLLLFDAPTQRKIALLERERPVELDARRKKIKHGRHHQALHGESAE